MMQRNHAQNNNQQQHITKKPASPQDRGIILPNHGQQHTGGQQHPIQGHQGAPLQIGNAGNGQTQHIHGSPQDRGIILPNHGQTGQHGQTGAPVGHSGMPGTNGNTGIAGGLPLTGPIIRKNGQVNNQHGHGTTGNNDRQGTGTGNPIGQAQAGTGQAGTGQAATGQAGTGPAGQHPTGTAGTKATRQTFGISDIGDLATGAVKNVGDVATSAVDKAADVATSGIDLIPSLPGVGSAAKGAAKGAVNAGAKAADGTINAGVGVANAGADAAKKVGKIFLPSANQTGGQTQTTNTTPSPVGVASGRGIAGKDRDPNAPWATGAGHGGATTGTAPAGTGAAGTGTPGTGTTAGGGGTTVPAGGGTGTANNPPQQRQRQVNGGGLLGAAISAIPLALGASGGGFGGGGDAGSGGYVDGGVVPAGATEPVVTQQAAEVPQLQPVDPNYQVAKPIVPEAEGNVDLVLEDVHLAAEPTKLAGPAYSVRFRNQGLANAGKFVVAAVASQDGQYNDQLPRAVLEVPGLAAGQSKDAVLRLPRGEFGFLILYLDAGNTVVETDKTNNAAVIERDAL
jgi:hypothetical protein